MTQPDSIPGTIYLPLADMSPLDRAKFILSDNPGLSQSELALKAQVSGDMAWRARKELGLTRPRSGPEQGTKYKRAKLTAVPSAERRGYGCYFEPLDGAINKHATEAQPKKSQSQPKRAERQDRRHHRVYHLFDAHGTLLYVGISVDPLRRMLEHCKSQHWWDQVSRIDLKQRFRDEDSARSAERDDIRALRPLYNIVHNGEI